MRLGEIQIDIDISIDIEVEIEEGEFVTLSTQPTVVDIRHSIHSTQPAVVGYTLPNLRLLATLYNLRLLEEEDEDSLEFLRMNHFPSVYTSPLSMLDLALTLLSTISLC